LERLFEIAIPESLGIQTKYIDLSGTGLNAYGYTCNQNGARVSLVDKSLIFAEDDQTRRFGRSTTAHESGHCFLHMKLDAFHRSLLTVGAGMKRERSDLKPYEDPEWQAWSFAGALTMPQDLVLQMINQYGQGENLLLAMVNRFDVNYSWARARLSDLKRMLKI
jgi:Zn-dependent peptidase ImmA (M78 family)